MLKNYNLWLLLKIKVKFLVVREFNEKLFERDFRLVHFLSISFVVFYNLANTILRFEIWKRENKSHFLEENVLGLLGKRRRKIKKCSDILYLIKVSYNY